MRGMYRFMHEVGNKLTQELITNAEKKIDFEYKVELDIRTVSFSFSYKLKFKCIA